MFTSSVSELLGIGSLFSSSISQSLRVSPALLHLFNHTFGGLGIISGGGSILACNVSLNSINYSSDSGKEHESPSKPHHPSVYRNLLFFAGICFSLFAFYLAKSGVKNGYPTFEVEYFIFSFCIIIAHVCFFLFGWSLVR